VHIRPGLSRLLTELGHEAIVAHSRNVRLQQHNMGGLLRKPVNLAFPLIL
jgi:hypothetical protein